MTAPQRLRRRPAWPYIAIAGAVLVLVAGVAWLLATAAAQTERNARLEKDVSTLANQVRALGGTPAVSPEPGPSGSPGQPGATGPPGQSGRSVTGPSGPPGDRGRTGASGTPGATVTGPPGPAGQDGADGADGADGKDGATGEQGPRGPEGPACPSGYHVEERTIVTTGGPETVPLCVSG